MRVWTLIFIPQLLSVRVGFGNSLHPRKMALQREELPVTTQNQSAKKEMLKSDPLFTV